LKEFLVGSKTGKVVHETGIPVLAVPVSCRYKSIEKIVLAMDSKEIEFPDAFVPLLTIAKLLEAKILVYHFEAAKEDAGMDPDIGEILKDVEHSFHYDLVGKDVNSALDAFVDDYQVDLICMLKRKRDLLSKIFHESATDEELYHSHLPVLILKE
jgi:nucleotide-binding universal stress UspA family protein